MHYTLLKPKLALLLLYSKPIEYFNMRKILCLILLVFSLQTRAQQDDAPVVGVSDKRVEVYGLKNARVVVDYQTTLENTDILISNGRIEAVGPNLVFPKGTIIYDMTGKTVYPSFVDAVCRKLWN